MQAFSIDHLNDVEFEEFCYDLLNEIGFVNLEWRKGTGLLSSPSDQGRDIECNLECTDVDGARSLEKWFVECKHYKEGVPPTALQGILAWATAEAPDTVLIIASNFLSNPAKNYLKDYERNNTPRFKIKVWERPDIEKLTLGKSRLLRKYAIVGEFPFLSILHPAHALYLRKPSFNSLDYLFEILDTLDPEKRDTILGWIYHFIIRPRATHYTTVIDGMTITVTDKFIDEVSYEAFKKKCYSIASADILDEEMIVFMIVNFVLQAQLGISDTTSVDEFAHRMEDALTYFRSKLEERPEDKESLEGVIAFTQDRAQNAQEIIEQNYQSYEYFCENVVAQLLLQEYALGESANENAH